MNRESQIHAPTGADSRTFVPIEEHTALVRKYDALRQDHQEVIARLDHARVKLQKSKASIKQWQVWYDKWKAKRATRSNRVIEEDNTPRALRQDTHDQLADTEARRDHSADDLPTRPPATSSASSLPRPLIVGELSASGGSSPHAQSSSAIRRNASSQTTEGEPTQHVQIKAEPDDDDDDSPVIVSTRSLKRKRQSPKSRWMNSALDGNPDRPLNVKEEGSSSPNAAMYAPLLRTETSDLDAISGYLTTPRKRQREQGVEQVIVRHYQQIGAGSALDGGGRARVSGTDLSVLRESIEENTPPEGAENGRRSGSRAYTDVSDFKTERWTNTDGSTPRASNTWLKDSSGKRSSGGPLQQLSTNTPTLPRTSTYAPNTASKKRHSRSTAAISLISEDGEDPKADTPRKRKSLGGTATPEPGVRRRLDDLLEGSSPVTKTLLTPRPPATAAAKRQPRSREPEGARTSASRAVPPREPEAALTTSPRTVIRKQPAAATSATWRHPPRDSPAPVLPDQEPLRARLMSRLSIDDFKINPAYRDTDYAYSESIRKRDQRRCLPGCTRPECCGSMRVFAEAAAAAAAATSTSPSADDLRLLEDYLGADHARVLRDANPAQRAEWLARARAQRFADGFGRHRQVFERRTTPPGFWRTDMPSTQEMEQDREAARLAEREKVRERWREAVRGGGRWIFRDE